MIERHEVREILDLLEKIMAELDDLNTNLAEVGTALDALEARVGTKTGVDPAAVEAAAVTAKGFADRVNAILP